MRKAPPVKAELPPREASGEISSCNTEAPFSLADKAAQVAALPAPTTMMSCSGISMAETLCQSRGPACHPCPGASTRAGTILGDGPLQKGFKIVVRIFDIGDEPRCPGANQVEPDHPPRAAHEHHGFDLRCIVGPALQLDRI